MSYIGARPLPISNGGTGQTTFPSFSAYSNTTQSNATGDATQVTVAYNATMFDNTSSFNTSTNTFTVPTSGNYSFYASVFMFGLTSAHTQLNMYLQAASNTWNMVQLNPFAINTPGPGLTVNFSLQIPLVATNTVLVRFSVSNGTKAVSIQGGSIPQGTVFSGYLLT